MDKNIVLRGGGGDLEIDFTINDFGWTRCYLVAQKKILLGADGLEFVVAGLLKALQEESGSGAQPAGEINGTAVKYAFHLEEAHHSLYYGDDESGRLLFWQADARHPIVLVGVLCLSPEQRWQWRSQLEAVSFPLPTNAYELSADFATSPISGGLAHK